MNAVKMLLLLGAGFLWVPVVHAQKDDKYLDDAYYRRSDIQKIDQEARRKAELRAAAARAEREAWEKEQAELLARYKRRKADREIDAYNGRLGENDTIMLTEAELADLLASQRSRQKGDEPRVYGPYSSRLSRFYGNGTTVIDGARRVYIDADPWYNDLDYYRSGADIYVNIGSYSPYWGNSWGWGARVGWGSWYDYPYSWYDSYYYPSYWRGSYWGYPRYYGGYYGGYYDPYYYYSGYYNGYYGGYYNGCYGGYYDYYSPYYYGYATGAATRAYNEHYYNNPYSHGARSHTGRSSYSGSWGGYSAYSQVRDRGEINPPRAWDGTYSTSPSQRARGLYDNDYQRRNSDYQRRSEPQQQTQRTYESYPARSYDRNDSQAGQSQNSGGGSSTPSRRR
ncbi:hypothetical protein HMPREF9134_01240 [Porphyromonas catoniae F0037]|jgi:hypothetical protein|uniref:Uncharacterized protein n=1 Tax=Porphyromonas catoniae F0037 TaxID=1127696 RepID=L1NC04_9PORP|nr:hypothetical protein [Porphyromonas catoniae]EKY00893.1 hypothetical protein HMPREF9134_01240 [Porphyromonas catoniae F0037]